jgi:molybdopterin-synthase adenylyltransferase
MLTEEEKERYSRQIMIPDIGEDGQKKLKRATVLIAGTGGLGSPVALYLAAAGIGTIRLVDVDRVELSNLNRQILHWTPDVGKDKVASAAEKLIHLNPSVAIEPIIETISEATVSRLVDGADAVVDALDNIATRYLLNKAAVDSNLPLFHGAVHGMEGRAMTVLPGKSACLGCRIRGPVAEEKFPVIGTAPAVIGGIQAAEVIKYITGIGTLLTGRMLVYDGMASTFTEFRVKRNPGCPHCGHL